MTKLTQLVPVILRSNKPELVILKKKKKTKILTADVILDQQHKLTEFIQEYTKW